MLCYFMNTAVEHNTLECRFDVVRGGKSIGYLIYSISDGVLDIRHTVVDSAARGQGLGRILVESAIDYAKKEELTIVPSCSYAERVMKDSC